ALKVGYRHIDTAWKYGTERGVGEGMRASGVPRRDIFLTTKVSHEYLRADDFARSVEQSLKNLDVDFVDLLLVHWPNPDIPLREPIPALAKAKRQGLARHIGIANFNIAILDEAILLCPDPLVNLQAEDHARRGRTKLTEACRKPGPIFTAYCPLAPVARPGARRHRRAQGALARADRAALAHPARQHYSDPAFFQRRAHGREPRSLRFCADR